MDLTGAELQVHVGSRSTIMQWESGLTAQFSGINHTVYQTDQLP